MTKITYPKHATIGCYFDGAHGQTYNDLRLLRMAMEWGFEDADATQLVEIEEDDLTTDDIELLSYVTDDAEEWLNEQEQRSFMYWGWEDGNFGLWVNVDSAKEDVGFVSVKSLQDAKRLEIETDPEDSSNPPHDYEGEWLHVNDHGNCTLYFREQLGAKEDGSCDYKDNEIWSVV